MDRKKCYGYIYVITNIVNGKQYVGQTNDCNIRFYNHVKDLKRNQHYNSYLQRSWNKYSENNFNFEVLEECKIEELDLREIHWIDKLNSYNKGYNLTTGGYGLRGYEFTEGHRNKISASQIGENNSMYGKKGHENPFYGCKHSDETKKILSTKATGRKLSLETRNKISENSKKKVFTKEERKKLSRIQREQSPITKLEGLELFNYYSKNNIETKDLAEKFNITKDMAGKIIRCEHWTTNHLSEGTIDNRKKLSEEKYLEIYHKYHSDDNISYAKLSKEYNVGKSTIARICKCNHHSTKHLK